MIVIACWYGKKETKKQKTNQSKIMFTEQKLLCTVQIENVGVKFQRPVGNLSYYCDAKKS